MTPAEKFAAAVRAMHEACDEMGVSRPVSLGFKSAHHLAVIEGVLNAAPSVEIDRSSRWQKVEGVSLRYQW